MAKRNIVVIGASAGGVGALIEFVKALPKDFDGSIFVVLHVAPASPSILPEILIRSGVLPAKHAKDGELIEKGKIYIAPPDHHMLIEDDHILVKRGPKENRFRPSVDALFRSAAYTHGPRVIGIVLSGLLDDGTSGLWSVKRMGGVAIIQDPGEATFRSMPESVLEYVEVDYILPVAEIGSRLLALMHEDIEEPADVTLEEKNRLKHEIYVASQKDAFVMGIQNFGKPTLLTCPECNGAMVEVKEGKLTRYRCHTGHSFTASSLLSSVTKSVEENLWRGVRGLEEAVMILEKTGQEYKEAGRHQEAVQFFLKANEYRDRSHLLHDIIYQQDQVSEDLRYKGNGGEKRKE